MIYTVTLNPALDRTLTVDKLEFNQVLRANSVRLDWGGKGLNVSRALSKLGLPNIAIGFIGGAVGRQLQQGLEQEGINCRFVSIKGETRTNIVIQEECNGTHIKVNEPGPVISTEEQHKLINLIRKLLKPGDEWVISGSLPRGIPADFYRDLILIIQKEGGRVYLDTSGEALKSSLSALPYLIKPNREEAETASGIKCEDQAGLRNAVQYFLDKGIPWVALSCGKDGLVLASIKEKIFAPTTDITVRNTVGAGDALLAGLIWAFWKGYDPMEVAAWGTAAGVFSASLEGVDFGNVEDIMILFNDIRNRCAIL